MKQKLLSTIQNKELQKEWKKYTYTNYFQPWKLYQKGKDTTVLAISNRKIYPNGNDTNVDTQKCKTDINESNF